MLAQCASRAREIRHADFFAELAAKRFQSIISNTTKQQGTLLFAVPTETE
jgi:hypothetical protein